MPLFAIFAALFFQVNGKAPSPVERNCFDGWPAWEQVEEIEFMAEELKRKLKGDTK